MNIVTNQFLDNFGNLTYRWKDIDIIGPWERKGINLPSEIVWESTDEQGKFARKP